MAESKATHGGTVANAGVPCRDCQSTCLLLSHSSCAMTVYVHATQTSQMQIKSWEWTSL